MLVNVTMSLVRTWPVNFQATKHNGNIDETTEPNWPPMHFASIVLNEIHQVSQTQPREGACESIAIKFKSFHNQFMFSRSS